MWKRTLRPSSKREAPMPTKENAFGHAVFADGAHAHGTDEPPTGILGRIWLIKLQ